MAVAPAMTWLFVTTTPVASSTMPVPAPTAFGRRVLMLTRPTLSLGPRGPRAAAAAGLEMISTPGFALATVATAEDGCAPGWKATSNRATTNTTTGFDVVRGCMI